MIDINALAQIVSDDVINESLINDRAEVLLETLCESLCKHGFPILRGHVATKVLHPMFQSTSMTWLRGSGIIDRDRHVFGAENREQWQASPLKLMMDTNALEIHFKMYKGEGINDFPMIQDLVDMGATDYWATLVPFGETEKAINESNGIMASFTSDRENGFLPEELDLLRRVVPRMALGIKSAIRDETNKNVMSAYLGNSAANQVLSGSIKRGDGEHINAVLWYCDMRLSTRLASELGSEEFLKLLNSYFECTAGSVLDHGGEVLRFVGDAVLAIFPIFGAGGEARACRMAMSAAKGAFNKINIYNASIDKISNIECGLGLHIGDVLYGNIGVPERLEFSVIGRAANEVARMEDHTKEVGFPVVVSSSFQAYCQQENWTDLGHVNFRGVGRDLHIYALNLN